MLIRVRKKLESVEWALRSVKDKLGEASPLLQNNKDIEEFKSKCRLTFRTLSPG